MNFKDDNYVRYIFHTLLNISLLFLININSDFKVKNKKYILLGGLKLVCSNFLWSENI